MKVKLNMKRIFLFVVTNLAVVLVLGIVANLLGVNRFLTSNGLNLGALLGFALIMGFGGAIISLLMSKWIAKMSSGVKVIDQPANADEAHLDLVAALCSAFGLEGPRHLADRGRQSRHGVEGAVDVQHIHGQRLRPLRH